MNCLEICNGRRGSLVRFLINDSGAVAADYFVVTALVAGLGLGGYSAIKSGVGGLTNQIATGLSETSVGSVRETKDLSSGENGGVRLLGSGLFGKVDQNGVFANSAEASN